MPLDEHSCDTSGRPGADLVLDREAIGATGATGQHGAYRVHEGLLKWMRYHFADPTRIATPNLVERVWTDEPSTPLIIASLAEYNPEQASGRPALLVQMNRQTPDPQRRSIDHRPMGGCGTGEAALVHTRFWYGQHTIHCVAGAEGEALLLATEIADEIDFFAHIVRPGWCLHRLELTGIGERRKLEEYKETWSVPVGLHYGYARSAILEPRGVAPLAGVRVTIGEA